MERVEFLYELKRFGVSMIQTTAEDLDQEITNAGNHNDPAEAAFEERICRDSVIAIEP